MRPAIALALCGWTMLCSGCALIHDGGRNLCHAVCAPLQTHRENARNRRWADQAWRQYSCNGPRKHSDDFERGFKEGYVEYLYRGGDGEPPLVAPARYRHFRYQSPDGFLAIEQWFAGYRQGSALARDTGMRNFITGPSGLHGDAPGKIDHEAPLAREPQTLPGITPPRFLGIEAIETRKETPFLQLDVPVLDLPRVLPMGPPAVEIERGDDPAEPVRVKIKGVMEMPQDSIETPEPVRVKIQSVIEAPTEPSRVRITGVSVPEPLRARITTITPAPKD